MGILILVPQPLKSVIFSLIAAIIVSLSVRAQTPIISVVPAPLERIEMAPGSSILGSVFLYKGRKLNSPFSVEIPIQELNDPVANQHFRRFRIWTTVGRLTGLASVGYVLLNRTPNRQTSRAVYIGSLVASLGFSLLSNHQVNSAVRRYNTVLRKPQIGFMVLPTGGNGFVPGIGLTVPVSANPN